MRFQYDGDKPITNLEYPEFWDVKLTGRCGGTCPWCYMNSTKDE
jgi:MoaA/NifB/PqqE/SkfB family radical SAM enzyme